MQRADPRSPGRAPPTASSTSRARRSSCRRSSTASTCATSPRGDAGEGRFVFAFYSDSGFPLQATMILEYKLPAATDQDVLGWAQRVPRARRAGVRRGLQRRAPGDHRAASRAAARGPATPTAARSTRCAPTRSTSATSASGSCASSTCRRPPACSSPAPLDLTPDRSFNGSDTLAAYINAQPGGDHRRDPRRAGGQFDGQPFQAGAVFNDLTTWFAPGVDRRGAPPLRAQHLQRLPLDAARPASAFLQIVPRFNRGDPGALSPFLRRHHGAPTR